ncbi:hypothetical protein BH11GEM1_BH11GEM1_20440 [soil metagenome]
MGAQYDNAVRPPDDALLSGKPFVDRDKGITQTLNRVQKRSVVEIRPMESMN